MNTNRENVRNAGTSTRIAARVAGFMFLYCFIVPTLNWSLLLSKLIVADDVMATANNILANVALFRMGVFVELMMSAGLVVLAAYLYRLLKPVNTELAILALCLKVIEAGVVASITVVSFVTLQFVSSESSLPMFTPEQLKATLGLLLIKHTAIYSMPMVFLGLDMMLFSYLLLKTKYVPKILAGFGILSFALIFIHAVMYIFTPQYASMLISQIVFYTPSGLFEIIIGIWLLIRGVKVQQEGVGS